MVTSVAVRILFFIAPSLSTENCTTSALVRVRILVNPRWFGSGFTQPRPNASLADSYSGVVAVSGPAASDLHSKISGTLEMG